MPHDYNQETDTILSISPAAGWRAAYFQDSDNTIFYQDLVCFALIERSEESAERHGHKQGVVPLIDGEAHMETPGESGHFLGLVGPDGNQTIVIENFKNAMKENRHGKQ